METTVKNIDSAKTPIQNADAVDNAANKPMNSQDKAAETAKENAAVPEQKKKRTFGNKIYDFLVFAPIAWGGVWVTSAATGYQALYGKNKNFQWLRNMTTAVNGWIHSTLKNTVMKNSSPENVKGMAENLGFTFILGMGSHALVAPIKWLEDHRQSNAAKIDKLFGTTPPDAETIKDEPKQGWGSVISGRMASWATAFVALAAMGPKFTKKLNDGFGEWAAQKWIKKHPDSNPKTVRNWANLLAFDALGTAVTAAVTYVFSRFVAASFGRKEIADTVYELNPVAPNPIGEDEPKHKSFTQKVKAENKAKLTHEPNMAFVDKVKSEAGLSHSLA